MKFKEVLNPEIINREYSETATFDYNEIKNELPVVIALIPDHPFDFPHHNKLSDMISSDFKIFSTLLETKGIKEYVILINKKLKSIYNFLSDTKIKHMYVDPDYPASDRWIRKITGIEKIQKVNWKNFLSIMNSTEPNQSKNFAVSFSVPHNDIYKLVYLDKKSTFEDLLKIAGMNKNEYEKLVFITHPFTGNEIEDGMLYENKIDTILALEKNTVKATTILSKLSYMLWEPNYRKFNNLYVTKPEIINNPCQRCLQCQKICPSGLVPFMISVFAMNERIKDAVTFLPQYCVECGLCSYVCPSAIPLSHNIKNLKNKLG